MRNSLKIPILPLLLVVAGCAANPTHTEMAEVSGQAFFIERMAVPSHARLEVVLEDISRPGMAAERLGETIMTNVGQPPYEFQIEYDPAEIDPRHSYRVAARLYDGDRLLFVTDQVHQVITREFPSDVSMRMKQVQPAPGHPLGPLPASFAGTLPCASCPGIDIQLDLLSGGVFFLRETYQDRENGTFHDMGRYLLSSHDDQVSLHGGREAPRRWELSDPDTLTLLDTEGARIESELNYSLTRQDAAEPVEFAGLMRGMYRYLAGAGRFRECLTGLDMPVATEGDNRALEQAYLEVQENPGEEVMVSLEGRISQRLPMEGNEPEWTLIPENFIEARPDLACPEPVRLADLRNTYWRLTLLDEAIVQRFPNQREPHLVFHEDGRLAGSDGCNRLAGRYALEGSSIEFFELAGTRMACPEGMAQADHFARVLQRVDHYRIMARHLEVFDADRRLLLRFEAVALR